MDIESMQFEDGAFDTLFCFFAVMYKEDLVKVLQEFRRVITDKGTIILLVPHPIRKMMKYNPDQNYFVKGRRVEVWKGVERFGYHRLFEDYIDSFRNAGLSLKRVVEPQPIKETEATKDSETRYPHFLLFELSKCRE